jgi:hypothetical protein
MRKALEEYFRSLKSLQEIAESLYGFVYIDDPYKWIKS